MKPKPDNLPWTEREDAVVRIASPEVAAEKLGRSIEAVAFRRQQLGVHEHQSRRLNHQLAFALATKRPR